MKEPDPSPQGASQDRRHVRIRAAVLFAVLLVTIILFSDALERTLAHRLFDAYQALMPRQRISAPAIIVAIDEASLKAHGQWPWPRTVVTRLCEAINTAGPAAVGIDIIFAEPDRFSPDRLPESLPGLDPAMRHNLRRLPNPDKLLAASLGKGPFVLGMAGLDDGENRPAAGMTPFRAQGGDPVPWVRNYPGALRSIEDIDTAAPGKGLLSIEIEAGIARRMPLLSAVGGAPVPALSLALLRMAGGVPWYDIRVGERGIDGVGVGDLFVPTTGDGRLWVHFGLRDMNRFVSAADVLAGRTPPEAFTRKIVLVGFTGLGLLDFITVPTGERMPGIEAHAQLLENIFDSSWLSRPPLLRAGEISWLVLTGLALIFLTPLLRPVRSLLVWAGMTAATAVAGLVFFRAGILFDALTPALGLTVTYGATLAMTLVRTERQRRVLQQALAREREAAARLEGEMAAAKNVQLGMLPAASSLPADPRFDLAVFMEPARQVGGDLYDFFPLAANRLFFLIGDVSGKGMPASLFMALSKALCKSIVLRDGAGAGNAPDVVLTQANIEAARDNPELNFVTAVAGVLDLDTGAVSWATAGHDEPVRLIAAAERVEQWSSSSGPPLCVLDDVVYNPASSRLHPGDTLVLFTDGITEAQDGEGNFYGMERLTGCLTRLTGAASAQEIIAGIREDVRSFVGAAEQADDMTVLAIHWWGERQ